MAIIHAMKATIDAAGRVAIPKALRQALGLRPGQELEIHASAGRLEISVAPTPMRVEKRGKGMVAVRYGKLALLTADEVREMLERVRR